MRLKNVVRVGLFILLLTGFATRGFSQGFFNQKTAWIKNQIQQIALWEVHIIDLKKGYEIAKNGLDAIGAIKKSDFHLHLDRFNALGNVNPGIRRYTKAIEIVELHSVIKKMVITSRDPYINSVWNHLLDGCTEDVSELDRVLTPGRYQLTDDERIARIDKLHADMEDKHAFARSFSVDIKILNLQQQKGLHEVQAGRLLNYVKP